jgi:hypothetical protein
MNNEILVELDQDLFSSVESDVVPMGDQRRHPDYNPKAPAHGRSHARTFEAVDGQPSKRSYRAHPHYCHGGNPQSQVPIP